MVSSSTSTGQFFWWKMGIVLFCILGVVFLIRPYADSIKGMFAQVSKTAITVVSKTIGTEMQKDQYGNVNVALLGYGGDHHGGGFLADTIIVASWNPELGAVSMISIPRDLYIKNPLGGAGRINAVFSQFYGHYKRDMPEAMSGFSAVLKQITGLEIPYYATIDFSGFKQLIDTVGGVDVNVPSALHDYQYPDERLRGYDPLHVEEGWQHMDGALALKYARSRHAAGHASDFDRSLRQQLIISALKDKILSAESVSVERIRQLYSDLTQMVITNVAVDEMLWAAQYADTIKMFSFGINNYYNPSNFHAMHKGAFLYNPSRELFGGASVMIPFGAKPGNLDHYEYLNTYADFAAHTQGWLLEGAKIAVENGISKDALRAQGLQNVKMASRLAAKMKRYGLEVVESSNTDQPQQLTTAIVNVAGDKAEGYEQTITALKNFVPIDQVVYNTGVVRTTVDEYGSEVIVYTGADVKVVLGESYLAALQAEPYTEQLQLRYR